MSPALRALGLAALASLVLACADDPTDRLLAPAVPSTALTTGPGITVLTQNMYLGANLDLLLTAQSPADVAAVFDQLGTTTLSGDFGRARKLAMEIAFAGPHLVGLQEVTTYTLVTPVGSQVLDFLAVLQAWLDGLHAAYGTPTYTAVRNPLTHVVFPASEFGPFPDVIYDDADAILVRDDVPFGDAAGVVYDAREQFSVAGTTFDNVRGYVAVTADVEGQTIRFVNTHLEVQRFEATQRAQASELIADLEDAAYPVVLVGDFNSAANHDAPADQKTPTYHMFRNAGYADLWLRQRHSVGGYTCCQDADLTNPVSGLTQRLDLVLVRYGHAGFGGQSMVDILGEEPADRIDVLPDPATLLLWPSDHAGVLATFWPAPGRRR